MIQHHIWLTVLVSLLLVQHAFAEQPKQVDALDHTDLSFFQDTNGKRQSIKTIKDWRKRRDDILRSMQQVMGKLPNRDKLLPLDVKVTEETIVGKLLRRKLSFQSETGSRVGAYLFLPLQVNAEKKLPAVLCLHQTTRLGKSEPAGLGGKPSMHYALELAKRGYVTLAPDFPSLGDYVYDFDKDDYQSGTMKAIWDNRRAVDLLISLPEVDSERIGCLGHSLGGHMAMFTAAFEPRIKVIVSSCGFTRFGKDDVPSWTGPRYMPRIASAYGKDAQRVPFDFPEIIASFAPRPFLTCSATGDHDFDVSGVRDSIKSALPIYQLYEKPDHLAAYYPESPHDFPNAARRVAYAFLDQYLRDQQ